MVVQESVFMCEMKGLSLLSGFSVKGNGPVLHETYRSLTLTRSV